MDREASQTCSLYLCVKNKMHWMIEKIILLRMLQEEEWLLIRMVLKGRKGSGCTEAGTQQRHLKSYRVMRKSGQ